MLDTEENTPPIYVITDRARGNGKYKLSNNEVVIDTGMTGLIQKVHPSIKKKAIHITSTSHSPFEDDELMAGYNEVFELDENNSIFRQQLAELIPRIL